MSVIVPALDEAAALGGLLADLAGQAAVDCEVIIADGGSRDDTLTVAAAHSARVVVSAAGRARQLNAGAAAAKGDWLCFLHADSRLTHPRQLARAIEPLAAAPERLAGHFALRFDRNEPGRDLFYRYLEAKSATNRALTVNGDQGLILHRRFFDRLGAFDTRLSFLEDQRMAAAIRRQGAWRLGPDRLMTSARRFEQEGALQRYLLMALIMAMHQAGVNAFFERAPAVYARQADTEPLRLSPYFALLRSLARDCGAKHSVTTAWRIAGIALAESWQPFFALDVALCSGPLGDGGPATRGHDRWLAPLLHNRCAQAVATIAGSALVFGPMAWCNSAIESSRPPE